MDSDEAESQNPDNPVNNFLYFDFGQFNSHRQQLAVLLALTLGSGYSAKTSLNAGQFGVAWKFCIYFR